jgi:hypothetical protein
VISLERPGEELGIVSAMGAIECKAKIENKVTLSQ